MNSQTKVIKAKVGLLQLAQELRNVSRACKVMGASRDSFYRFKQLYEQGGADALREVSRRKPIPANRVLPEVEAAVVRWATDNPALGQFRVANELLKEGIFISAAGVRCVWKRHDLETFQKRLHALEERVAREGLVLCEAQLASLERKKDDDEAHGEIETEHPGYLGAQDTYYVGNIKGVGRIYQQTFIDTYSRVALCKLYTGKHALTAADLLNDRVVPFFEEQEVPLLRILTDRGTEYNGASEQHEYQLYLQLEGIQHSRTKVRHPQTNGICERLHRTMQEEFYAVAFRKKLYQHLGELQTDLDSWLHYYNFERTHSGRYCFGKTPIQTFREARTLVKQKLPDTQFAPSLP